MLANLVFRFSFAPFPICLSGGGRTMDKEIKPKIMQMMKSEMGYKSIDGQLSLSMSAVRSVILSKYNDQD